MLKDFNAPAFQMYAQDFLTGVMFLTNEEVGIYIRILTKQWTDGKIPKKRLAFLVGIEWEKFSDELKEKFEDLGDFIQNKRLENEREKMLNYRKKQSKNGKKGGRPDLNEQITAINGAVIPRIVNENDHFLYVFQKKSDGTFKIGETQDLFKRRLTIKVPTADLKIIHFVKIEKSQNLEIENKIKQIFPNNCISGDWFDFTDDELDKIIKEMDRLKKPKISQKNPLEDEDEVEDEIEKEDKGGVGEKEILDYLNLIADKKFKAVESNLKFIRARLKEESPEVLKQIIEMKTLEWKHDPKMNDYLRPETLFNATKFQSYLEKLTSLKSDPNKLKNYAKQRNHENRKHASKHYDPLDAIPD